jgi:hypothetical protein
VLSDLVSIGPATIEDLRVLGVNSVEELAGCDAEDLYQRLCRVTGARHDPCCRDVFAAGIAQARDPDLPADRKVWWYWSRQRKEQEKQERSRTAPLASRAAPQRRRTSGSKVNSGR